MASTTSSRRAFDGFADDLLGLTLGVDVGGVDEVDARIERGMDHGDRLVMVGVTHRAEHHRSERDVADRYAGATKYALFHVSPHDHILRNYLNVTSIRCAGRHGIESISLRHDAR